MCFFVSQSFRPLHRASGFTVIELMVVVAILATLAGLAAPSFTPIIERWRVRQTVEDLQATMYYARSEAIKRGGSVAIVRAGDDSGCTAVGSTKTLWSCGWTVFADDNNNGTLDTGETTLQVTSAPTKVQVQIAGSKGVLSTDRWGQFSNAGSSNFDFRVMPQGTDTGNASALALCIGTGGRIKQLKTGNGTC